MASLLDTIRGQIMTSIFGRRLGLDKDEYLVGPKTLRQQVQDLTTSSSATAVPAYGVTRVTCTGSSQGPVQYLLDAPAPGVEKALVLASSSTGSFQFLTTAAGAKVFSSSAGTSAGVINLVGQGAAIRLIGLATDTWGILSQSGYTSTAMAQSVTFTTST